MMFSNIKPEVSGRLRYFDIWGSISYLRPWFFFVKFRIDSVSSIPSSFSFFLQLAILWSSKVDSHSFWPRIQRQVWAQWLLNQFWGLFRSCRMPIMWPVPLWPHSQYSSLHRWVGLWILKLIGKNSEDCTLGCLV